MSRPTPDQYPNLRCSRHINPRSHPTGRRSRPSWSSDEFDLYGERVTKRYKTFLATWRPAGGVIRVVLLGEEIRAVLRPGVTEAEIQATAEQLLSPAA